MNSSSKVTTGAQDLAQIARVFKDILQLLCVRAVNEANSRGDDAAIDTFNECTRLLDECVPVLDELIRRGRYRGETSKTLRSIP